jgi:hypothetical protein
MIVKLVQKIEQCKTAAASLAAPQQLPSGSDGGEHAVALRAVECGQIASHGNLQTVILSLFIENTAAWQWKRQIDNCLFLDHERANAILGRLRFYK